ncbi:MAG: thiamine diphosphokinase [Candidatus Cloacimonadota bacterium]|nr:thiamine diphosphokinase [Candidatus Cloacimonadota bacterium]
MDKAYIFCNNNYNNFTLNISKLSDCYIVAADGGANFLFQNGIPIDALVGDCDSIYPSVFKSLTSKTEIVKFPFRKDKSDTELAVEFCISKGFNDLVIVNSINGQFEHSLANIFIIEKFINQANFMLLNKKNRIFFINNDFEIEITKKKNISLLPLTDSVLIAHTKGLEYSTQNERLYRSSSRGISNYNTENKIFIAVKSGILICIIER